ncbi:alanyl-tRNA editing protein [Fusobacterium sp. MFO224]|uniref:alanyl-tRNA editing protein n=1 Tax=Fusobacterium sp. MFO224 TaxID=3378070 RepID=UPI003852B37C
MKIRVNSCNKIKGGYEVMVEYIDIFSLKLYPDGKGGQLGDRGNIDGIKILKVTDDKVVLENEIASGVYDYEIDMERREDIAIQHSAEHLFSGIAKEKFGLNNVGFRMTETITTIDLDSNDISEEIIKKLMDEINLAVKEGGMVETKICSIEEARKIELRKPISSKIQSDEIRIVKISNFDICACAGFHTGDLKDIRVVKLVSKEIKGKNTRFSIIAGQRAIDDYEAKSKIITDLNHRFSCRDNEILSCIEKQFQNYESLKKEFNEMNQKYAKILYDTMDQKIELINGNEMVFLEEKKEIINEIKKIFDKNLTLIGLADENIMLLSNTLDCGHLIGEIKKISPDLKGGGKGKQGNLKGNLEEYEIKEILKKIL